MELSSLGVDVFFFFSDGGLEVHQELLKNAVRATTERHRLLGSNLKFPQN